MSTAVALQFPSAPRPAAPWRQRPGTVIQAPFRLCLGAVPSLPLCVGVVRAPSPTSARPDPGALSLQARLHRAERGPPQGAPAAPSWVNRAALRPDAAAGRSLRSHLLELDTGGKVRLSLPAGQRLHLHLRLRLRLRLRLTCGDRGVGISRRW